jgi:hypothetical protein
MKWVQLWNSHVCGGDFFGQRDAFCRPERTTEGGYVGKQLGY